MLNNITSILLFDDLSLSLSRPLKLLSHTIFSWAGHAHSGPLVQTLGFFIRIPRLGPRMTYSVWAMSRSRSLATSLVLPLCSEADVEVPLTGESVQSAERQQPLVGFWADKPD